ncbi:MAG: ATP-binding protein [Oscillospiraceae bacterium]|nr:ATP-binding protein [Oscillospiraceae bacterium]
MKKLPIQSLIDFKLQDDHVVSEGKMYYLYRYFPSNISIMTDDELKNEIDNFAKLLDTLRRPFSIFATDKIEDLTEITKFYESLAQEYNYITSDILSAIEDTEVKSSSVQRAFYIVYQASNADDDIQNTLIGHGYNIQKADKKELSVLFRNYLLREFTSTDIYDITTEVDNDPKIKKTKRDVYNREILRRLTPRRIDFETRYATQNDHLRKTIMVKNFPHEIPAACLQEIASIRNTSFHMRLSPMPTGEARRLVDAQIKNRSLQLSQQRTKLMDAAIEQDAITNFYLEIARNKSYIYRVSIYIEMYAKDRSELEKIEAEVDSALIGRAITTEKLTYEQKEGFKSVYPLGRDLFLNDSNNMPSTTIAALYPYSYSCRLDKEGMLLGGTVDGGIMFVDLWARDSNVTNSNYCIVGTSGQGKSYLQKKIVTQQVIRGTKVWILDPENEYTDVTRHLGGTVYNCASGEYIINPFQVRQLRLDDDDTMNEPDIEVSVPRGQAMFYQHLSWLHDFYSVLIEGLDPTQLKALDILTQEMYENYGITERTNIHTLKNTEFPTFTNLYDYITGIRDSNSHSNISADMCKTLLLHLTDCTRGSLGAIFNGHTNIKNDNLMCFSMSELIQGSSQRRKAALFNITTYIWNEVCRNRNRTNYSMLNIDELYLYFDDDDMTMVKYLNFFVKRARKYNTLMGIATQQLADCLHEKIVHYTTAMFNNSSTKFFFYPDKIDLDLVRRHLKLTEGEIECIDRSNRQHCLVCAGNDRYYMRVGTLPYEEVLFGRAGGR